MAIEVVVLQAGKDRLIHRWFESGASLNQLEWERTALEVARRAIYQPDFRVDIFLCLKADYLVSNFDHDLCRALSEKARAYGWGAKLYIAASADIDYKPHQREIIPYLVEWFDEIHHQQYRATDVVLAGFDRASMIEDYHLADLRRARDESVSRYDLMPGLIIPDEWHCWAASSNYQSWLADVFASDARNLILVVHAIKTSGKLLSQALQKAEEKIRENPRRRFLLGVISRKEIPPALVALGNAHRIPVVQFRGLIELRYFFLRLNRLCGRQSAMLSDRVEAVPLDNQIFRFANRHRPRLLLTSAFNPEHHATNCLDAVNDVAEIVRHAPAHAEYDVYPCLRATDFPNLLRRMPDLVAWVHLGHGEESGLQDSDGNSIKIEEWFARLQHHGVSLPLAFLSVCHSAATARRLAQAGIGVAIGFEGKVLPKACRDLSRQVVRAALDSNGSRRAILQEYNQQCSQLEGLRFFRPKAYYAVR
jgi:hypothetical protein